MGQAAWRDSARLSPHALHAPREAAWEIDIAPAPGMSSIRSPSNAAKRAREGSGETAGISVETAAGIIESRTVRARSVTVPA